MRRAFFASVASSLIRGLARKREISYLPMYAIRAWEIDDWNHLAAREVRLPLAFSHGPFVNKFATLVGDSGLVRLRTLRTDQPRAP